ncbi:hypothetical protein EDD11_002051 [Mortierella claussenii]|nr:hypothetical protein EDD11_002051 [Mortierella claussenii]
MTTARPHRLLWSPHPNHNQFLIGSTELRLFKWTPEDAEGKPHATPIAVNTDVSLMKCFTWSPDSNYMDLTAVGLTTGRTLLIRMHRSEPWIFEDKGNDFRPDTPRQVSIAQNQRTYPSFSARHSRACNVVAFSKGEPNLLAVGLDKVRNDYCLMVWDIEQSMPGTSESSYAPSGPITASNRSTTGSVQTSRFGRTTEIAESYFDTRLSMNPLSLAENTSTARALNASSFDHSTNREAMRQYGSSEVISSCAWFNHSPRVLAAGMGMKYIRVYDTREDANSPSSMVISTKAVHGLCMDPFHEDRMASCTDDGNIQIWDIRKPSQPILTFDTGPQKAPLVRIQFNPQRSGLIASLTKEASCLKVWDIQEGTVRVPRSVSRMDSNHTLDTSMQHGSASTSGLLSRSHDRDGLHTVRESESEEAEMGVPILWKSRRTKPSSKSLQSFAWIPTFVSNSTSGLISINKESLIETTLLKETSQIAWEPRGALMVSDGSAISCFPSQRSLEASVPEPAPQLPFSEMRKRNSKVINLQLPANRRVNGEDPSDSGSNNPPPSISIMLPGGLSAPPGTEAVKVNGITNGVMDPSQRAPLTTVVNSGWISATAAQVDASLEQDVSVTMRGGAIKGYSMDAATNLGLVGPGTLKDFWAWMFRAEKIAQKDGARIGKFDFSYQGVLPVLLGNGISRRSTPSSTPRTMSPLPRTSSDLTTQLSKQADEIPIVPTLKLAQRKLGLKLCGSELLRSDLKKTVEKLEGEGSYEVAAGWAFFHGELDLAIEVLSRGDDKLKLMSIVVAGFTRNHTSNMPLGGLGGNNEKASNSAWRAQCRSHSQAQSNPYIRAIFSYIASGDWRDVLDEKSLSLADRVGVALRFLSDDELMVYIESTAKVLINSGEIDGIILTGLTETGLDLITNYVNRTGDIQTAALASSVAVPRYFKDPRVEEWIEGYRDLLDRWQLYYTRARFDIARGRCIQQSTLSGVSAADMTPTQIYVRCNFCNQSIARNLLIPGVRGRDGRRMIVQGGGGPGAGGVHGGVGLHGHDKQSSMGGMGGQAAGAVPGAPGAGPSASSSKAVVCPSCSKPLPRCAICLLHLGVPAEGNASLGAWSSLGHNVTGEKPTSFDLWFTWCQTCRHGGHAMHMAEWFDRHTQCPVSDCNCLCSTHDAL